MPEQISGVAKHPRRAGRETWARGNAAPPRKAGATDDSRPTVGGHLFRLRGRQHGLDAADSAPPVAVEAQKPLGQRPITPAADSGGAARELLGPVRQVLGQRRSTVSGSHFARSR